MAGRTGGRHSLRKADVRQFLLAAPLSLEPGDISRAWSAGRRGAPDRRRGRRHRHRGEKGPAEGAEFGRRPESSSRATSRGDKVSPALGMLASSLTAPSGSAITWSMASSSRSRLSNSTHEESIWRDSSG